MENPDEDVCLVVSLSNNSIINNQLTISLQNFFQELLIKYYKNEEDIKDKKDNKDEKDKKDKKDEEAEEDNKDKENKKVEVLAVEYIPSSQVHMYLPTISIIKKYYLEGHNIDNRIILKLQNRNPEYNKFGVKILHENEVLAYQKVLPALHINCEKNLLIPKIFYAHKNTIVMEDLNIANFHVPKSINHDFLETQDSFIASEHCSCILRHLAKFHSLSIIAARSKKLDYEDLKTLPREPLFFYKQSVIFEYISCLLDKLIEVYSMKCRGIIQYVMIIGTLQELKNNSFLKIRELVVNSFNDEYAVFCHGDLRAPNIFINNEKQEVKFIDFQHICFSSVARDLVTLFYVNLDPKDLKDNLDKYLTDYLTELHLCIKNAGIDLEDKLTLDWLKNEVKKFHIYGIIFGLWYSAEFYTDYEIEAINIKMMCEKKCTSTISNDFYCVRAAKLLKYYKEQSINDSCDIDQIVDLSKSGSGLSIIT